MIDLTPIIRHAAIFTSLILASSSIYISPAQSQQRACVITDEGTTVCGKPTTSKKKTQETTKDNQNTESSQEFRLNDYVFSLKECRDFRGVVCELTVVNNGTERELTIIGSNQRNPSFLKMIGITGKEYITRSYEVIVGELRGRELTFKTPSGNSYPISMQFSSAPRSINKAKEFYLYVRIDGTPGVARFTDIDIKPRIN